MTERMVEPYQFSHSTQAIIVFTWQVYPELDNPSWRNFRIDRIVSAVATADQFRPRHPVTLHTGEVRRFDMDADPGNGGRSKASPMEKYTNRLHAAMADLDITPEEKKALAKLAIDLSADQLRAAHGRFYAEALLEICADGRVDQQEMERLTAVRVWLNDLGWSP